MEQANESKTDKVASAKKIKDTRISDKESKDVLKDIETKLRKIMNELEHPSETHETYDQFVEIETLYDETLLRANYEFIEKFKKMMVDFEHFLKSALAKMSRKDKGERSRSQIVDIWDDVNYFLANGTFAKKTVEDRAVALDIKPETLKRIVDLVGGLKDESKYDNLFLAFAGKNKDERIRAIMSKYKIMGLTDATHFLKILKEAFPRPKVAPTVFRVKASAVVPEPASLASDPVPVVLVAPTSASASASASLAPVPLLPPDEAEDDSADEEVPEIVTNLVNSLVKKYPNMSKQQYVERTALSQLNKTYAISEDDTLEYYTVHNIKGRWEARVTGGAGGAGAGSSTGSGLARPSNLSAMKGIHDFSKKVVDMVSMLSFKKEFDSDLIKGSSSFRSMKNNSDYDMFEIVYQNASYNTAVKECTKRFQEIINDLMKEKETYIMDIKSGVDQDLDCPFAHLNGKKIVGYKPAEIKKFLSNAFAKGWINQDQYGDGLELVLTKLNLESFYDLKDYLRKLKTIRWAPTEIIKGEKILSGDRRKYLHDAIQDKVMIKIDVITTVSARLVEFSMIYEFWARSLPINATDTDYVAMVKEEIQMLYTYGKYMKMDKRILLLDRYNKDVSGTAKFTEFFNGSAGSMNKIKGDMEAINALIEKFPTNLPWKTICTELDIMRERFSNIYDLPVELETINETLLDLSMMTNNAQNRKRMFKQLDTIMEYMGEILNEKALAFNKKNHLEPLPARYM